MNKNEAEVCQMCVNGDSTLNKRLIDHEIYFVRLPTHKLKPV